MITRGILRPMEEAKTREEVAKLIEEAKDGDRTYWHSRTPQERLRAVQLMREKAYWYDAANAKIQRVFEIVKLKRD